MSQKQESPDFSRGECQLIYPIPIPLDFVKNFFLPPLLVRLIPAATEITGIAVIFIGVKVSQQDTRKK